MTSRRDLLSAAAGAAAGQALFAGQPIPAAGVEDCLSSIRMTP